MKTFQIEPLYAELEHVPKDGLTIHLELASEPYYIHTLKYLYDTHKYIHFYDILSDKTLNG